MRSVGVPTSTAISNTSIDHLVADVYASHWTTRLEDRRRSLISVCTTPFGRDEIDGNRLMVLCACLPVRAVGVT